jgi:antibiotic biosynthesis monooxygenase (ABM) superfamily enzyme
MASTTAVTIFHPVQDVDGFDAWLSDLRASAHGASSTSVSVRDEPGLDWALAVTFSSEDLAHDWLDSAARRSVMEAGQTRGFWCRTTDLVLTEGGDALMGVSAFRHSLAAGKQSDFRAVQSRLVAASLRFPGYEGTVLLPDDAGDGWLTILRFRTTAQLSAWLQSSERDMALPGLRSSLTKGFSAVSSTTPFATTVRVQGGRTFMTPNWKSAMLVLLVLYPTVMLLSRFFIPLLEHAGLGRWLALWVSQIASVSALQWILMPNVTRPFRTWLDPVDGAGLRISAIGAAAVVAGYVVSLALFSSVMWLRL